MIRAILILFVLIFLTPALGLVVIVAQLFRVPYRPDGVYDWAARTWVTVIDRMAGVQIVLHNTEHIAKGEARIFVGNHISWFDVFAMAEVLPHYTFVAKSELRKIPVFNAAATAWGAVWIERENRKSAFESYKKAGEQIKEGRSVVVFPEGTRGYEYPLRRFKKGPFVLAIASGVPVVPAAIYGTIAIQPKGKYWVKPGRIDIYFHPAIPTANLSYDDRDALADQVRATIAQTLLEKHGVVSPGAAAAVESPE